MSTPELTLTVPQVYSRRQSSSWSAISSFSAPPCRKLSNIAFGDMNPFPRRLLRNRRALHLERLQGELQQLAEQQEEFVTERAERKDKDLDPVASEDDDDL